MKMTSTAVPEVAGSARASTSIGRSGKSPARTAPFAASTLPGCPWTKPKSHVLVRVTSSISSSTGPACACACCSGWACGCGCCGCLRGRRGLRGRVGLRCGTETRLFATGSLEARCARSRLKRAAQYQSHGNSSLVRQSIVGSDLSDVGIQVVGCPGNKPDLAHSRDSGQLK